jgi:hypothetical protein
MPAAGDTREIEYSSAAAVPMQVARIMIDPGVPLACHAVMRYRRETAGT